MTFTVIIPARHQSTRLPGKPLLDIAGKPMIQHVYERVQQSQAKDIYIATDDERIRDCCRDFGAPVCMTSPDHQSGTDRIHQVAEELGLNPRDIVVNVQGDEPLIPPEVINQVARNLAQQDEAGICTLYEELHSLAEAQNPNLVKVVTDREGFALYFSRAPIPWPREGYDNSLAEGQAGETVFKRHIGIYAYRVFVLQLFVTWPMPPLEKIEKLEQLRAMWHGTRIHVAHSCQAIPAGVDTHDDLETVRGMFT